MTINFLKLYIKISVKIYGMGSKPAIMPINAMKWNQS